jgi:hypothetical protein
LKPKIKRSKLDQKANVGILIGYNSQSKAYRIYDLKFNKVVIARDIKVAEGTT